MIGPDPEAVLDAAPDLEEIDFRVTAHRVPIRAARSLRLEGAALSYAAIIHRAQQDDRFDDVARATLLSIATTEVAPRRQSVAGVAALIRNAARMRRLAAAVSEAAQVLRPESGSPNERRVRWAAEGLREALAGFDADVGAAGPAGGIQIQTAEEILAGPEDDRSTHLWEGVVAPMCVTLLAGYPKAGKSWLAFSLAAEVADGGVWAGRTCPKTPVLILSEEAPSTIRRRGKVFGIGRNMWILPRGAVPASLGWPGVVRFVSDFVKAHGIGLVIVDTFSHWAALPSDGEKDEGLVRLALRPLQDLAAQHSAAVVVVHHMRKGDGDFGEAIRGSSALCQVPDALVELRFFNGEESPDRVVKTWGRLSDDRGETVVRFCRGVGGARSYFDFLGNAKDARTSMQDDRLVEGLVKLGRWVTAVEAHDETGVKQTTVESRLPALFRAGKIQRRGTGKRGDAYLYAAKGVALHALTGMPKPPEREAANA